MILNGREIHGSFGRPHLKYKCKYIWPENIFIQANDFVDYPDDYSDEEKENQFSFEVFIQNEFYFVERSNSIVESESKAWNSWQRVKNCKHEKLMKDKSLPTGTAICKWCGALDIHKPNSGEVLDRYYNC